MMSRFITLEGGEGVGKSTHLAAVADFLRAGGDEVVVTREPGGTPYAEELRALLLSPRAEAVMPSAELLTLFAARAQHWHGLILPALQRGAWVLSDRFVDATYAYQGAGRGLAVADIAALEHWLLQGQQPGLTLLLDMPVADGMARARARAALDRFESEQLEFFERVRAGYLARAAADPQRIRQIDAGQSLLAVQADVLQAVRRYQMAVKS
ncbi:MAG: dTMP kinase [Pseudomonadota bacterium]